MPKVVQYTTGRYAERSNQDGGVTVKTCPVWLMGLVLLLAGCRQSPAVDQLLERVDALESAIENHQNDTAMAMLREDFTTSKGQNRKEAQRLLLFHAMRHEKINIIRSQTEAHLDPAYADQGEVSFLAVVTGGQSWIPEQGRSLRVQSRWIFTQGDWYLQYLEWEPAL